MGILKMIGSRGFFWGIGAAALSYILYPKVKETVKPVLDKGVKGANDIAGKTVEIYDKGKERVSEMFEDTVKKAEDIEHNAYKTQIDNLKLEREKAVKEVNELKSRIEMLEREISALKDKE